MRLRTLVVLVLTVVVVTPMGVVWGIGLLNARVEQRMLRNVQEATSEVVEAMNRGASVTEAARRVGEQRKLGVRVISAEGRMVAQWNYPALGSELFGPASLATSRTTVSATADGDAQGVGKALEHGMFATCSLEQGGHVHKCLSFVRSKMDGADVVVVAQQTGLRGIQRLPEVQRPMWVLAAVMMVVALGLAALLVGRIVGPIESLRRQVQARSPMHNAAPRIEIRGPVELQDLAEAFDRLLRALDERSARNQAFVDDLAHEVKKPLATMRACAEMLEGDREVPPARAVRLSKALRESSARLERNVAQWLDLARAEAGLVGQTRSNLDLSQLASALADRYRDDTQFEGRRFIAEMPSNEVLVVQAVERDLEVAIRNLIDNAAAATPAGEVRIRTYAHDRWAIVEVVDTGPGIPAEILDRVFDRFFTTRSDGSGLGLSLTKAIAHAHGGMVEADNAVDGGAVFRIVLPRC